MKIVLISGSRNPEGQTARAANAALNGAESEGAEVERIFLPQVNVGSCRQCDINGWGTCITDGVCRIQDDLAGVIERIKKSDAVIFATPVYYGDLAESIRSFLDRLRRTTMHAAGKEGIGGKPAIGVCVAGGGGGGAYQCCHRLEQMLGVPGFDVMDLVPVRRQNMELKETILRSTGKWLAASLMAKQGG